MGHYQSAKWRLSVTIHMNCIVARYLINVVYLKACAFVRSWRHWTFCMTSPMTLTQYNQSIITPFSLVWVNQLGKLINRIPGSRLLISSLPGSALRTHVESLCKPCNVNKHSQSLTLYSLFPWRVAMPAFICLLSWYHRIESHRCHWWISYWYHGHAYSTFGTSDPNVIKLVHAQLNWAQTFNCS